MLTPSWVEVRGAVVSRWSTCWSPCRFMKFQDTAVSFLVVADNGRPCMRLTDTFHARAWFGLTQPISARQRMPRARAAFTTSDRGEQSKTAKMVAAAGAMQPRFVPSRGRCADRCVCWLTKEVLESSVRPGPRGRTSLARPDSASRSLEVIWSRGFDAISRAETSARLETSKNPRGRVATETQTSLWGRRPAAVSIPVEHGWRGCLTGCVDVVAGSACLQTQLAAEDVPQVAAPWRPSEWAPAAPC